MAREQRRLAAIVSADVAGYSRLMGRDESRTLAALKAHRRELIDPAIAEHGGRVVKAMGDGLLLEFPSVVDAVRCAVEVQDAMARRNAGALAEERIDFRVGINVGDIIAEGDDIFGDGVNVAARVEALAEAGGICVSRVVRDQVRDKLGVTFESLGAQVMKNIARPVEVYRVAIAHAVDEHPAPNVERRESAPAGTPPSIAVLPFANRSHDPEDEYFADGLADEMLHVLARIRGLRVAARSSSFTFKSKPATVGEVGRALNVDTVLEGSVRKSGSRMRIVVQLVKVADGYHLWSQSYDRDTDDIFAVQEDIARSVVKELRTALLGVHLEDEGSADSGDEVRAALADSRTSDPEAYRLYMQGRFFADRLTGDDLKRSIALYEQAIGRDPRFALAHAGLSAAHFYATSNEGAYATGYEHVRASARRALEIAPDLAEGHACLGLVHASYDWDWKAADRAFRRARELAPGNSDVLIASGQLAGTLRRNDEAIAFLRQAMELDPLRAPVRVWLAAACYLAERYDEAESAARSALEINPTQGIAYGLLSYARLLQGNPASAIELAAREDMDFMRFTAEAMAHRTLGDAAASDAALARLVERYDIDAAFQIAQVHAWRGENDRAFEWLGRAYKHRDPGLAWWNGDPLLRGLHGDARWAALMAKMAIA